MKKIVSLCLALIMVVITVTTSVFAADVLGPEKHTVTLTANPGENVVDVANTPRMWNKNTYDVGVGTTTYTPMFYPEHRYLGFEFYATGAPTELYSVEITLNVTTGIAGASNYADGSTEKIDWVEVETFLKYQFRIINYASTPIQVTVTYYTWP